MEYHPAMKPPLFLRSQVNHYALFLVGRVGSTYLTSLLNSHPHILAHEEELRDRQAQGAEDQLDWTHRFLTAPMIGRYKAKGFNVKLVQLENPQGIAQLLRDGNCRILHMQRRNRIKAVISRINGQRLYDKTGQWGLFNETNRMPPLEVNLQQFDEYLRHRESVDQELQEYVRNLQLPTLPLYYEDMLQDQSTFLHKVFAFLEVEPRSVEGMTLKITSDSLREALVNFDEVRAMYVGTHYEAMFDEVITPPVGLIGPAQITT
jgi:LPS sulfotransferase NodH